MNKRTPALAGFDPTVVVEDRGLSDTHETKYTVDAVGNELLLYSDTRLRARDRAAVVLHRIVAALPRRLFDAFARRTTGSPRLSRRPLASSPGTPEATYATRTKSAPASKGAVVSKGTSSLATADAGEFAHPARVIEYDHAAEAEIRRAHVLQVLRHAAVPATVMPSGAEKPASVVIRDSDLSRACAALAAGLDRSWRFVPLDAPGVRARKVRTSRLAKAAARRNGFRLFRQVPAPVGPTMGEHVGVDVEVWAQVETRTAGPGPAAAESEATLVAQRRQTWTPQLTGQKWQEAVARGRVDVGDLGHLFEVATPIDVVYTWVDGADPVWNEQRLRALGLPEAERVQSAATHAARFRSHDELRYSLRSLEMFAPWVRRVHVVTAGQVPEWLDVDHPRMHVVDHREIFTDPDVLPVFNSHAIESQLHHIPHLAEQYLYLNDDVFFGRPVSPSLFFHGNGLAKFFKASALIDAEDHHPDDVPVMSAAKNNRDWIAKVFGRRVTNLFQHTPHPQLRSVLEQMESEHPDLFAEVAASTFRHPDDVSISSALHHYYAYALGKAVPGRLAYLYLDLAHPRAASRLRRLLRRREFDVFCLNDSPDVGKDGGGELLQQFLERYYPLPSSFELPAGDATRPATEDVAGVSAANVAEATTARSAPAGTTHRGSGSTEAIDAVVRDSEQRTRGTSDGPGKYPFASPA